MKKAKKEPVGKGRNVSPAKDGSKLDPSGTRTRGAKKPANKGKC
jgi:hypothetical protein